MESFNNLDFFIFRNIYNLLILKMSKINQPKVKFTEISFMRKPRTLFHSKNWRKVSTNKNRAFDRENDKMTIFKKTEVTQRKQICYVYGIRENMKMMFMKDQTNLIVLNYMMDKARKK